MVLRTGINTNIDKMCKNIVDTSIDKIVKSQTSLLYTYNNQLNNIPNAYSSVIYLLNTNDYNYIINNYTLPQAIAILSFVIRARKTKRALITQILLSQIIVRFLAAQPAIVGRANT